MDVTRENYEELFEDIVNDVNDSDFLSIDCEFTGLNKDKVFNGNLFDTPEDRYKKLHQGSLEFLIIQFGLCTFKRDDENDRYVAKPYNLYVFPEPMQSRDPDNRFLCQSSSIKFLVDQGFDFNKLFRKGIPYLSQHIVMDIKDQIMSKHEAYDADSSYYTSPEGTPVSKSVSKSVSVPKDQKAFMKNICASIKELIDNRTKGSINLPICTGYQRKLIFEVVKSKYSSLLHLETKTNEKRERYIEVSLAENEQELKEKKQQKQKDELNKLNRAVGLSRLLKVISQSGKVVVGHNMLLDLFHIVQQFFINLPPDYSEFKSLVHCIFPRLLDTKLMASTQPFKDLIAYSSLGDLKDRLKDRPFHHPKIFIPDDFPSYSSTKENLHEAGYDAYITGLCVLSLKQYLASFQGDKPISIASPLILPFLNKLCLMKVNDIPYINLVDDDLNPSREHVFHVSFPKSWKTEDIHNLFEPFGRVRIGWINDTSAFVGLHFKNSAHMVVKHLCSTSDIYTVQPWSKYRASITVSRKRHVNSDTGPLNKRSKSLNASASPFITSSSSLNTPESCKVVEESHTTHDTLTDDTVNDDTVTHDTPTDNITVSRKEMKSNKTSGMEGEFEVPSVW